MKHVRFEFNVKFYYKFKFSDIFDFSNLDYLIYNNSYFEISKAYDIGLQRYGD